VPYFTNLKNNLYILIVYTIFLNLFLQIKNEEIMKKSKWKGFTVFRRRESPNEIYIIIKL